MNSVQRTFFSLVVVIFVLCIAPIVSAQVPQGFYGGGRFSGSGAGASIDEKPCTFTPASGITLPGGSLPCNGDLLAQYMLELNRFFFRLAVVLGVLMVTIGGFQWLVALGNAGKISNAKETIEQAVIGLILAFTSVLLLSQIDTSFIQLSNLSLDKVNNLKIDCSKFTSQSLCPLRACVWLCPDGVAKNTVPGGTCKDHGDVNNEGKGRCDLPANAIPNRCVADVLASATSKNNNGVICGYSYEEQTCLESPFYTWSCCINTQYRLFTFTHGVCNDSICKIPAYAQSGGYSGNFWTTDNYGCGTFLPEQNWKYFDAS